jgi:hypothetical protein
MPGKLIGIIVQPISLSRVERIPNQGRAEFRPHPQKKRPMPLSFNFPFLGPGYPNRLQVNRLVIVAFQVSQELVPTCLDVNRNDRDDIRECRPWHPLRLTKRRATV